MKKMTWIFCSVILLSLMVSTSAMADFTTDLYGGTIPTLVINVGYYNRDKKDDVIISTATEKYAQRPVWLHVLPGGGPDNTVTTDNPNGCFIELGNITDSPVSSFYACITSLAWITTDYDATSNGKPTTDHTRVIGTGYFCFNKDPILGTGCWGDANSITELIVLRCDTVSYTVNAAHTTTSVLLSGCTFDGGVSEGGLCTPPCPGIQYGFLFNGSISVKLSPPL